MLTNFLLFEKVIFNIHCIAASCNWAATHVFYDIKKTKTRLISKCMMQQIIGQIHWLIVNAQIIRKQLENYKKTTQNERSNCIVCPSYT